MRELFDALDLLAQVITALPVRYQLLLALGVLFLGVLGAGVMQLAVGLVRWCRHAVRRRGPAAEPDSPEPRP